MTPWTDRSGQFSALKAGTLALLLVPAALLAYRFATGGLGPRPFDEAIHETGSWAIRCLVASLAITPARRIFDWPKLIIVRRMVGLAAFFYAAGHFALYVADMQGDLVRVAGEIASRIYLTIGFAALLGLSVMAATSTDAAIRRLGSNWGRLHAIVYALGVLAAIHFFMQTKADVFEATFVAGLLILLLVYRLAHRRKLDLSSPVVTVGCALVAAVLTAVAELAWYGLATGVPVSRVLAANLQFGFQIRPAWWVLAVGLGVALVGAVLPRLRSAPPAGRRGRARSPAA
jgi:sulfoxide reductase heme-binding subunit YedZ